MQGQRTNAQSFRCHQWSVSHVKRLDTTSKTLNSRRDIIGIANFTSDAFKVQCWLRPPSHASARRLRVSRISKDRKAM